MSSDSTVRLNEKVRVSLPVTAWFSVGGLIVAGTMAWATLRSSTSEALDESKTNGSEIRELDKRTQRIEDTMGATLERIEQRLDRIERYMDREDRRHQ